MLCSQPCIEKDKVPQESQGPLYCLEPNLVCGSLRELRVLLVHPEWGDGVYSRVTSDQFAGSTHLYTSIERKSVN